MKDTEMSLLKTGTSLTVGFMGIKLMNSILTSSKGFLAANSKYTFMNTFPIPNSVILMLLLSGLGMVYVWHKDINK